MTTLRIGIVGYGYWGPKLARNVLACPLTNLIAICEPDPVRFQNAGRGYPGAKLFTSLDQFLQLGLDAVAIATPVSTHFDLAAACLEAGMHVLVEKPLAASVTEAEKLALLAQDRDRLLMVDHTYLYSNPVSTLKTLIENDELGELYYVDSIRINLGRFQQDVNVVWDLAAHDLSIVDYVLNYPPNDIAAWGGAHADPGIENIAYVNVNYKDRLLANFHVNWLSPVKIRQMIFAGKRKSLVYNELDISSPLKIYDRGIHLAKDVREQEKLQVGYRSGDIWCPHVEPGEALQNMVTHFAQCVLDGTPCRSDAKFGLRIVRYLEAATRSLASQGRRIKLNEIGNGDQNEHDRLAANVSSYRV